MKIRIGIICMAATTAALSTTSAGAAATVIPLEASTMIIKYNASAEDIGVPFFFDSDGWHAVEIFDPNGEEIFRAGSEGRLTRQGGGTELFPESVELPLNADAKFPADILQLTVPDGLLKPASDYIFEVLAVEEGGNQTITEGCFRTAR